MRTIRALGSALILLALVVGIPLGLSVVGAELLPSELPTWEQIQLLLRNPLSGDFLVGALMVVGWIAWATFTIAVIVEAASMLRGRRTPKLPALGAQQRLAAVLLAAIALGMAGGTSDAIASPAAPEVAPQTTTLAQLAHAPSEHQVAEPGDTLASTDPQQEQAGVVIEVQPGDTLWDLAATHLGDAHRWHEIAALNYGTPQPGGGALTDSHWIEPGWRLQLPQSQQPEATDSAARDLQVTVEQGDTLYRLAEAHLGDGDRYPEIVQASADLAQPGGDRLTDPDLIRPGWQVIIPGAAAGEPAEQPEATDPVTPESQEQPEVEPAEPTPTPLEPAEPTPTPLEPETQPATAEPTPVVEAETGDMGQAESGQEPAADDDSRWVPSTLQTAGGLGALLAASVAAAVLARRRHVSRTAPPGSRLPIAEPATEAFERELRAIADPIGRESINIALRDLAAHAHAAGQPVPPILFVRYAGDGTEMQVYLEHPAALPHPWLGSDDQRIWSITNDDLAEHIQSRTRAGDVPAAYPALVGLGLGDQATHLLLDLERMRHLDLRGEPTRARGVLAALLLELVTSDWADDLQVTVVGEHADLAAALASPRLLHLDSPEQALARIAGHEQPPGQDPTAVRWPPEVVFLPTSLDQAQTEQLQQLVDAETAGVAFVTIDAGCGQAAIDLQADTLEATLQPSGMPIQIQHLDTAEYNEILAVLNVDPVPGPAWTTTLAQASEPDVDALPSPDPTESLPDLVEPAGGVDVEYTAPHVRMLGPVELVGADTSVLSGTIGHLHAAVEMTAYLSLHAGATAEQLTTALWPNQAVRPATRHSAISRTRRLLGTTPEGTARLEGHSSGAGTTTYHLTDVGSDWADFTRLHGPDPTHTPLADLRRALLLVRGAPFSQVRDGAGRVRANRYLWSDTIGTHMVASIVDVACETARRALLEGRPRLAAEAADAGLRASTDHERLWRYAITARLQTGEHAAAAELVDALTNRLTELDVDPQPETNTLLDHVVAAPQEAS
jgi:nucleoid-associated protein YgaU/DNA-binding SARP family transcriptional activator